MSKNEPPSKGKKPINKIPSAMKSSNVSDDDSSKRNKHLKPPSTSFVPEDNRPQHVTKKSNRIELRNSEYSANSSVKRKSNVSLPERTTTKSDPTVARRTSEGNVSRTTRKAVKAPSTPVIPEDDLSDQPSKSKEFFVENETKELRRRWMGRGGSLAPEYSPYLPPMDYFVWGHVKQKLYKLRVIKLGPGVSRINSISTKHLFKNSSNISKISTTSGKSVKVTYSYENRAFEDNQATANDQTNVSIAGTSRANSVQSLEVYKEQYCCFVRRTRCEKCLLVCVTVLAITVVVLVTVIVVLARENKLHNFLQF